MPRNRAVAAGRLCFAAGLLLSGCAVDPIVPVSLTHRSVLDIETRGMALSADGTRGHAGMYGVTCDFRTRSGVVGADYDFPSDEERVEDAIDLDDGEVLTLTSSPDRTHLTRLDAGTSLDLPASNGVHARLLPDGVVLVRDTRAGCIAELRSWDGGDTTPMADLPAEACDPGSSVATDREGGILFVTTDAGVIAIDRTGWSPVGAEGDLVAWDAATGRLYAGRRGSSEIRAHDADGGLQWVATVPGVLRALADLGEVGGVSASLDIGGDGMLRVLDAASGEIRGDVKTPTAADALVVPASGAILGLVTGSQTHFYEVQVSE